MKKYIIALVIFVAFGMAFYAAGCGTGGGSGTTTTTSSTTTTTAAGTFSLTSSAFTNGGSIPINNAQSSQGAGANNQSVPLAWSNAPATTSAFALRMIDAFFSVDNVHWLVVNIPSSVSSLAEGASPSSMPAESTEITNDYQASGQYEGPWPPTGVTHNYEFTLYALSSTVDASAITVSNFSSTVAPITLDTATLTGSFTGR